MSPPGSKNAPEAKARNKIDAQLTAAGWVIQYPDEMNVAAARGVAVCEFPMAPGHGYADYLLFVDGQPVGAIEAKPAGYPLLSVEPQALQYTTGGAARTFP